MTSSTEPTPVVAPANTSVIDKLRATGMSDDQIVAAIMGFGQQQTQPAPAPQVSANDYIGQLRAQGYNDEQITATVVAAAANANVAGSGDPTAAGGVTPSVDALSAQLDTHAGNVANVQSSHAALTSRTTANEEDINAHAGRLQQVEAWIEDHGKHVFEWFVEHRAQLEELLQLGATIAEESTGRPKGA